jgi:MerR family transcriptional regulator, heat shock protein HspR
MLFKHGEWRSPLTHADDEERDMIQPALDASEEMRRACEALCQLLDSAVREPSDSEPRYVISVASRMVGIEAHRLRHYERLGFVRPGRSDGNTRLYSQEDIDQLCCVKTLMNDLGLNSAGVQFALVLMQRMDSLQRQVCGMSGRLSRLERRRRSGRGSDGGESEA